MAYSKFPPSREADLVTWVGTFKTLIVASPTTYGLVASQATEYEALATAFIDAYIVASADATRSPSSIITKDAAKKTLIANTRQLAGIIQKFPGTTDTMRSDLGLTVPAVRAPQQPPSTSPKMDVGIVDAWTVNVTMHESTVRRGKPAGVIGASVFSYVGNEPPTDLSAWVFQGSTGRTKMAIQFDNTLAPGAKVWLTAFWFNYRKESGPACDPISTYLQGGGVAMAA